MNGFWFYPAWHGFVLTACTLMLGALIANGIWRRRTHRRGFGITATAIGILLVGFNLTAAITGAQVADVQLARGELDQQSAIATSRGEEFDPDVDLTFSTGAALDAWWKSSHVQNVWVFDILFVITVFVIGASDREYWRSAWRQVSRRVLPMICFGIILLYSLIGILDSFTWQDLNRDDNGNAVTISAPAPLSEEEIAADATGNKQRVHEYKKRWEGLPDLNKDQRSILTRLCKIVGLYREASDRETTYSAPFDDRLFKRLPQVFRESGDQTVGAALDEAGLQAARTAASSLLAQHRTAIHSHDAQATLTPAITLVLIVEGSDSRVPIDCGTEIPSLATIRERLNAGAGSRPAVTIQQVSVITSGSVDFPKLRYPGGHPLGTNESGQDVLYMSMRGIRTALIIGCVTTLIAIPFAILFGVIAGYFGGWVDDVITYVYAVLGNIPSVLLIAAVILLFGQGLFQLCVVMGLTSWVGLCRLLRGETLKLREMEYVQAAKAFGVSQWKILARHIVPNVMHIVLISFILRFSGLVLAEAVLSYLGIGVGPETGSWGNMIIQAIRELARQPMVWWSFASAMIFMLVLVLAANIFGDAVRDALDPRLRTR